jgi:hypothetical protein
MARRRPALPFKLFTTRRFVLESHTRPSTNCPFEPDPITFTSKVKTAAGLAMRACLVAFLFTRPTGPAPCTSACTCAQGIALGGGWHRRCSCVPGYDCNVAGDRHGVANFHARRLRPKIGPMQDSAKLQTIPKTCSPTSNCNTKITLIAPMLYLKTFRRRFALLTSTRPCSYSCDDTLIRPEYFSHRPHHLPLGHSPHPPSKSQVSCG